MPLDLKAPMVLTEARESLGSRTLVASVLRTAEWQRLPQALRIRAFFSAGVESVRFLDEAKHRLNRRINLERGGQRMNRSRFVGDLREIADVLGIRTDDPKKREGLEDIGSVRRLDLIYDTQIKMAEGHANWKRSQDPDVLDAFPAQELLRVQSRKVPREWRTRWEAAGGELVEGRMAALINDPIWRRISRFGNPWPPFDFGSGMGLRKLSRSEAENLGLLEVDEPVAPGDADFNDGLEHSLRGISTAGRKSLHGLFGDQIDIAGDTIRWVAPRELPIFSNWKKEGLDRAITWTGLPPFPQASKVSEATLEKGFKLQGWDDQIYNFDKSIIYHFDQKIETAKKLAHLAPEKLKKAIGAMESEKARRMIALLAAQDAAIDPDEVWFQLSQRVLIKGFSNKHVIILVVNNDGSVVRTFFESNLKKVDSKRTGTSVLVRRKK